MKAVLSELVSKNYFCISTLFYYGNLEYRTEDTNSEIGYVNSKQFPNLESLQTYLQSVYVDTEVERLLYTYFEERPLYFEIDNRLAVHISQVSGVGMARPWKDFVVNEPDVMADKCSFSVTVSYEEDENCDDPNEETFLFSATKDEEWKLDRVVYFPIGQEMERTALDAGESE